MSKRDVFYMQRALTLAEKGTGFVSPNPLVGAVLVKNEKIIAEGYHQTYGQNHAEINAIESAKVPVSGSTLYCNLEPCCHLTKNTPPCVPKIIEAGIRRVVISSIDPNPKVAGRGVKRLKEAGVDVLTGILQEQNEELNRFFYKYITGRIPYITVKIAQTLDGKIALEKGKKIWITNDNSKKLVHKWRAAYDATLVGANTILIDKPELTVREVRGRNPIKIVLDGNLRLQANNHFFNDPQIERTIVLTREADTAEKKEKLDKYRCRIIQLPATGEGIITIEHMLIELGKNNIASILVEGGQKVFSQFLSSKFIDEVKIFIAPKLWGKGINCVESHPQEYFNDMRLFSLEKVDDDILLTYRLS